MKRIKLYSSSAEGNKLGALIVGDRGTEWEVEIEEGGNLTAGGNIIVRKREGMHQFIMRMPELETHEEQDKYILILLEEIQELLNPQ